VNPQHAFLPEFQIPPPKAHSFPESRSQTMTTLTERHLAAAAWQAWLQKMLPTQLRDGGEDDGAFREYSHGWCDGRYTAFVVPRLVAVRLWTDLIDADMPAVEVAATRAMRFVLRRQQPDGTLDLGGATSCNEAGFPIPALVEAHRRLQAIDRDWASELRGLIAQFVRKAADAVVAGDAHTANHRWAAAAGPLAAAHTLFPDERYLAKIESYLADGIDCDAEGCWFEERGVGYNNVANHGMLVLADCLGRREFLEPVVRNQRFMLHNLQPNGEADTSYSFRQDRGSPGAKVCEYRLARRGALESGDGRLTTLAILDGIHAPGASDLMPLLFDLDRFPGPLPAPLPLPETYEQPIPSIPAVRVRRGPAAMTLAADKGGHFFDTVRDQWGGPRRSEDWFMLQHGGVTLASVQLAVAQRRCLQPRELEQIAPGSWELRGHEEGWWHTLHFRPGSPRTRVAWDLDHAIRVTWSGDRIDVAIEATSPGALVASLRLWVRSGATLLAGDNAHYVLKAGERIALDGSEIVLLGEGGGLRIAGLPPSAHAMSIDPEPSIPTATPRACACLSIGLRMPVTTTFSIHFIRINEEQ